MMKQKVAIGLILIFFLALVTACSATNGGTNGDGKKLVIGIDDKFAPMGFRDEKNEIVGFDIDYAKVSSWRRWACRLNSSRLIGKQRKRN